jgi:A/G-specific adenine glycosylase
VDEIMHLWTGLGYYARARNLHATARRIQRDHAGQFPDQLQALQALPGIGRSTAGAILSFAFGQRQPILDGNVKRVLSRYQRIAGWPGDTRVGQELWRLADSLTPNARCADYNQAIMDLGAAICRRGQPECDRCPHVRHCLAYRFADQSRYPESKPRKARPNRHVVMPLIRNHAGQVLLVQRPPAGVWGGLWSLPEWDNDGNLRDWCRSHFGLSIETGRPRPDIQHTFSHFHLRITPVPAMVTGQHDRIGEQARVIWYDPGAPAELGLAAPIKRLLEQIRHEEHSP